MLPRGGPSSDPRSAGAARLQIIPVLIALTWLVVAAIRIDQLTHASQTASDVAQLWAVASLTALALLFLAWQHLSNRARSRRDLDRALLAISRLERITDIELAELPTEELLDQLVDRVREGLSADAAALMLPTGDGDLEVRATAGLEITQLENLRVPMGAGLAGLVAVRKTPVAMSDLNAMSAGVSPLSQIFTSAAGAPLIIDGDVTGVLIIANRQTTKYDEDDIRLLQIAAQRCANVAEATRLRDAEFRLNLGAEHARRHLGLLVDASRIFMESVSDFETGLVRLVELAVREFAGFGAVYLAQGHEGLKLLVAQHNLVGPSAELQAFRDLKPSSLRPVSDAMAAGRSMLVKSLDPAADAEASDDAVRERLHALGITSYVISPIQVRGLAYGALIFGTVGKMRGFRPSDQGATEELARRAALAIEASLLYREAHESADLAESRAERLARLLEVWLSISTALDKPDGLESAAGGARRVLDARRGYIAFTSPVYDGGTVHADSKTAPALPDSLWQYLCDFHRPVRSTATDLPPMPAEAAAALAGLHWLSAPLQPSRGDEGCVFVVTDGLGFTDEDESLLVLLSQMISTSLTNAQLHAMTRENEARLTALIESSPVAIVDLALDGAVRSWNAAAATLFDWPADAASGWQAGFDQPMAAWIRGLIDEAKDGDVAHFECSYEREDGAEKALVLSVSPVPDPHGGAAGMLLVANDETERRQLARQFQEAQRLEAVGRMAGAIAHDFNNLLTIIIGYADSLLRRMDEHDPQRERIATIARAGNRGAALTRQLLAVSRRQVVAPIVLRPIDVLVEVESLITRLVGEDVTVRVNREGDARPIRVDKNQLEQAILNLAANARDAMREGGDLTFDVVPAADPSYVAIRVIDTGIGMDDQTLAHCLEPFYTTKDRGEGTGLGLAAVYGIITQGGGDVSITSRVGHGTTVSLLMPAVDAPLDYSPTQELPTPHTESRVNSGYILLIEDEQEVRSLVRRMLRERGYTVMQAPSAQHALALLKEYDGPLDLLLTDVVMPGMKGPELARRVALERRLPVLFMSGYAEELVDMPPDFEAPTAFLAKPFSPDQLVDAVRKLIAVDRATSTNDTPASTQPESTELSEPRVAIAAPDPDKSEEWDRD